MMSRRRNLWRRRTPDKRENKRKMKKKKKQKHHEKNTYLEVNFPRTLLAFHDDTLYRLSFCIMYNAVLV